MEVLGSLVNGGPSRHLWLLSTQTPRPDPGAAGQQGQPPGSGEASQGPRTHDPRRTAVSLFRIHTPCPALWGQDAHLPPHGSWRLSSGRFGSIFNVWLNESPRVPWWKNRRLESHSFIHSESSAFNKPRLVTKTKSVTDKKPKPGSRPPLRARGTHSRLCRRVRSLLGSSPRDHPARGRS